jgi:hypothetical protein
MPEGQRHPGPAAGTPALDRALGHTQDLGGLGHPVTLHVDQHDCGPLLDRQPG